MSSSILLKALGLTTSPNELSQQDGALSDATNVVIRRDNIIENRRGFHLYGTPFGTSTDTAKQLFTYQSRLIKHYNNTLSYDSDGAGTWADFSGSYTEPVSGGNRIRSIESNGNFYFTTSTGVKKISATSASQFTTAANYITQAGGIKAIDITTRLNIKPGVQTAFFTQDSTVGYRAVWGTIDANNNLVLGTPSQYNQIYNPLINLIIYDFNRLMGALDDQSAGVTANTNASGTVIDNENYMTTNALQNSSTAASLKSALINVATQLDADCIYANDTGTNVQLRISAGAIASGVCTITFSSGNPQVFWSIGNNIYLNSFSGAGGLGINGAQVVTATTATTITFTTSASGTVTITGASITSNEYRNLKDSSGVLFNTVATPSTPPVNSQLTYLQSYLLAIVKRLQVEPTATISSSLQAQFIAPFALTTTADVLLDIGVPSNVTTKYFFQLYRSQIASASPTDVLLNTVFSNDELQLVYEAFPTAAQISAGIVTVEDITLPVFAGSYLYTNPYSGEGPTQANDIPPVAQDINIFKNAVFYANTRTKHILPLNLLGVVNIISDYYAGLNPSLLITDGVADNTYTFVPGLQQVVNITCVADVANSLNGKYFTIYSARNYRSYYVWYKTSGAAASDPAPAGTWTSGIEVFINTNDSAATVATKTANTLSRFIFDFSSSIQLICNTTSGSTTISNFANTSGLATGMPVSGTGIPGSTTISTIGNTSITVNNTATSSNTNVTLTFGSSSTASIYIINNDVGYTNAPSVGTSGFTITVGTAGRGELVSQNTLAITLPAGSAFNSSGSSNYFTLNAPFDRSQYYVWFQSGTSTDPAPAGRTGIQVNITNAFTATQVSSAASTAINTVSSIFTASPNSAVVTVTNVGYGPATNPTATMPGGYSLSVTQAGALQILLSNKISPSQAVDESARSMVRIINRNPNDAAYAYYLSSVQGVPGEMSLQARQLTTNIIYALTIDNNVGLSFSPSLAPGTIPITNISVANPTVITANAHGLSNGSTILIVGSNSQPNIDGEWTVGNITTNTFTIPIRVLNSGNLGYFITTAAAQQSSNEVKSNRIYYAKVLEPEAVPITNNFDVGAVNKAILRIFPLRDSLFVFKEDGLWRISGETPPYNIARFDSSCILLAPDSLDVSNNLIYGWTTQGISSTSEAGVKIVSRPIDINILKLASSGYNANFKTMTWGVGYESDNSYTVYVGQNQTDTKPTIGYRYSNLTNSWTTIAKSATCATINPADDKMYIGAGDTDYIEQERKSFDRTDYADREVSATLTQGNFITNNTQMLLSSIANMNVGDSLFQLQYLTIYEFNQLLAKLNTDPGLSLKNYNTLNALPGDDISLDIYNPNTVSGLAVKLDSEPNLVTHNYVSTVSSKTGSIVSNTAANPTVITTSGSHGLVTGRIVTISGASGSTPAINGIWQVTVLSPTTFSIPVNVSIGGTGGTYVTNTTDFRDAKACFAAICNNLNLDSGTAFKNYTSLNITTGIECVITGVSTATRIITLNQALPFIQGPLTVYNAIHSSFTYAPQTLDAPLGVKTFHPNALGDPLMLKHMREATIMFENQNFTTATLSFATDLNQAFQSVTITGSGPGTFGNTSFGNGLFGGSGATVPFRTYIPRDMQRCRYMTVQFQHSTAREKYSVIGTTLTGEIAQSSRAFR